jgi:SNF2 family DNA or RNA helicase
LGLLHRLRSICADPRESGIESVNEVHFSEHCQRSPKLAWLITQLKKIREVDQKVIIFTEFRDLQRMIQHRTHEHFGFSPVIINGGTKVGSEGGTNSRQTLIDAFQAKSGFGVLILSTTAVGFGVNIQAANHVIHFTRAWNPAKEDQATDRAYRIGQENIVHVYYPTVISGTFQTFEEKLDNILEIKRQLASDMLNGTGEIDIAEWADIV